MKKTVLKRNCDCWKPLFFNDKEIETINFYENGVVYASTISGYLEKGYNDCSISLTITEVKKAIKLNLNRKDNFIIRSTKEYRDGYDLYINLNNFKTFTVNEEIRYTLKDEIDYQNKVTFEFLDGLGYETKEIELSEEIHPISKKRKPLKDEKGDYIYKTVFKKEFTGFIGYYTKVVPTEYGAKKKALKKELETIFKLDHLYINDEMYQKFYEVYKNKE